MRTCYILGAGFSASAGLPTVAKLFDSIFVLPKEYDEKENDFEWVKRGLRILYPTFYSTADVPSYPSFEQFLSLTLISQDFGTKGNSPGFNRSEDWRKVYTAATRLLGVTISQAENHFDPTTDNPIRRFCRKLSPLDNVITFNWDSLVERQLTTLCQSFSLDPSEHNGINIMKLHGSLSWVSMPEEIDTNDSGTRVALDLKENLFRSLDYQYSNSWSHLDSGPMIIPPIFHKRPLESQFIHHLWFNAVQAIINSDRVVIIGYSLPDSDIHARAMLRSAIGSVKELRGEIEVIVIDPDPGVLSRAMVSIADKISFHQEYFNGSVLKSESA